MGKDEREEEKDDERGGYSDKSAIRMIDGAKKASLGDGGNDG